MQLQFTKMQGIGNDYIYVNCFNQQVDDPAALAMRLSDRHFGVGGDGVILIKPSETADCEMDVYNADGSRAMMCGNGIRCVGKFVYERGLVAKEHISVDTRSGVKLLDLHVENGVVRSVRVDMGEPRLAPADIPVSLPGERVVNLHITLGSHETHITCVSMGNPHCVVFSDSPIDEYPLEQLGPRVGQNPLFPQGVNFEVVRVLSHEELELRVWERGSGETLACGTGACAAAVAAALNYKTGRCVRVHLVGGDLNIEWAENGHVYMEGPAEFVFDGTVEM